MHESEMRNKADKVKQIEKEYMIGEVLKTEGECVTDGAFKSEKVRKNGMRIFLLLTIAWMVVIFLFSSQPAKESTDMSEMVGYRVAVLLVPGFTSWSQGKQQALVEQIDHPIRKCAHATEYAILAGFLLGTISCIGLAGWRRYLLAWGITVLYAVSDELHQIFVPGRAGMATDVMIDGCGGLAMCLLWGLLAIMLRRSQKK